LRGEGKRGRRHKIGGDAEKIRNLDELRGGTAAKRPLQGVGTGGAGREVVVVLKNVAGRVRGPL